MVTAISRYRHHPSQPGKQAAQILLFILLALIFFLLDVHAAKAQRPYYFGRTKDPTPVELQIPDRGRLARFIIPKVYMTFSENWNGGLQNIIVLETIFPSMAPLSATRNSTIGTDVLAIHIMSYEHAGGDYNVSRVIDRSIAMLWRQAGHIEDKFDVYTLIDDEKRLVPLGYEYLVPTDSERNVYFECLSIVKNVGAGCTGYVNFGRNISVEFQFRRTELHKWREIRDAILQLLNSFAKPSG